MLPTEVRRCSRCPGHQHLRGYKYAMGVYQCNVCAIRIGFDLHDQERPEFIIHRGEPRFYTKGQWGPRLQPPEQRLSAI